MSVDEIPRLARILLLDDKALPLLKEALTHRTYAVEHSLGYDNQRLEFLGDAVLEIIHTEYLFNRYPELSEGDLTKIRSALSCEGALAKLSRRLNLGHYLLIGKGEEEMGGNNRESTLADLFEAVLGAIYIGAGMERARAFVLDLFEQAFPDPKTLLTVLNPKGLLQEYSQRRWGNTPDYLLFRHGGPQHDPFYEVEVHLADYVTLGHGHSRKLAEIDAARRLCAYFTALGE